MAEYIERECAIEAVKHAWAKGLEPSQYLEIIPTADVAPVRHGHCPYCDVKTNDFIPINHTVEYGGIEIALNRQGMLRVRVYESGQETFNAQDIVEIKFCPNCGAKMDGGSD